MMWLWLPAAGMASLAALYGHTCDQPWAADQACMV